MGETCRLHTERLGLESNPWPSCSEVTVLATAPLCPPNLNPGSKNYITPLNYFAVGVSFDHTCSAKVVNFSLSPLPAPTSVWEETCYFSSVGLCAEPAVSLAVAMLSYQGPRVHFRPIRAQYTGGDKRSDLHGYNFGKTVWMSLPPISQQREGSCSKPADI